MGLVIRLVVGTIAVFVSTYIVPGVAVDGLLTAFVVAVVLGVINVFVKPILSLLTLPLTILTLGFFTFVLNALLIMLVGYFVPGFTVDGFVAALIFGIVMGLVSYFLSMLVKD